jgi:sec-independent protein translocase protein TatA
MFRNLGPVEIILIVVVILLLFGAKRIPEIARSLGKSLGEFKKGQQEGASPDSTETEKKDESKPDKST